MTNKPSTQKKKQNSEDTEDQQSYLGVAVVFFAVAVAFMFNDSTRTMAIVFGILGITFLSLGFQQSTKDTVKKKSKK